MRRLRTVLTAGAMLAAAPGWAAAASEPAPIAITPPSREAGAVTARIAAPTVARSRPGRGRRIWRAGTLTGWSHHAQTLLVLDAFGPWLKVLLPVRPNGASGWIPRDKALLHRTPYWIRLRLRTRRVTVYRAGRPVRRFRAVVGAPRTPTPRGLAAIYERNAQPSRRGFLGPWALSLTALSSVLESYGGGPGRVAIHGRGGASLRDPLGSARSHGCVRVSNRDVAWLARHVGPGTPVRIRL